MATRKRRYVEEDYALNQDIDDDSRDDIHPAKRHNHQEDQSEATSSTHAHQYSNPSYEHQNEAMTSDGHGSTAPSSNEQNTYGNGVGSSLSSTREGPSGGASTSQNKKTIRFLITDSSAGAVIGRGGANIKKVREDTGVVVEIEGNYGWESRVVFISGAEEESVVKAFITVFLTSVREMQQAEGLSETAAEVEAKLRESTTVRFLVPDRQVGGLIGRGGERVKGIRDASNAVVDINSTPGLPEGSRGMRVVKVQGKLEDVLQAQKLIYSALEETYGDESWHNRNRNDRRGGGGGGGGGAFGRGGGSFGEGYGRGRGYGRGPSRGMRGRGRGRGRGGGMRGRGRPEGLDYALGSGPSHGGNYAPDFQGGGGGGYNAPRGFPPRHAPPGGGYGETLTPLAGGPGPGAMQGPMEDEVVSVPAESIGKIIGKGGSTVKDIRMRSGCKISIQNADYGSPIAVITLTGSKPSRDTAKYLIRTLL